LTELLTQQFEAAKIDEAKDISIVQVLDKAVEPERKSKPKRVVIVLLSAFLTLLASILWAFVREAATRMKASPRQASRLETLRGHMKWK
jgi:uncharacterized protein involved in exopolysaccharide biosynthesis